jgi:hypothetical protein
MAVLLMVVWINPAENIDLYPAVLKGFKVQDRFRAPQKEFFSLDTRQQAEELKSRIEQHVPLHTYS